MIKACVFLMPTDLIDSENGNGNSKNAEQDPLVHIFVYMVLNVEGIIHHSKPIRMQNHRSVMVPDEVFSFELQGNVLGKPTFTFQREFTPCKSCS
jgi:hypothetical protein